jgi:RNA polymerase sigma-70 factor, ECF subfamily
MSTTATWSPERVARMLHVSLKRVMDAIENKHLSANRVGQEYLITHEQLEAFMQHGNPFVRRTEPTDEALMVRVQNGDSEAFNELDARYRPKIEARCLFIVGDLSEAEDLTQETLIKVFLNRDTFDSSKTVAPWIMQLARNTCIDRLRSSAWKERQNQVSLEESQGDDAGTGIPLKELLADQGLEPQQLLERDELWQAMKQCRKQLTPRERWAILARFFEGLTFREMMSELDVTSERGAQFVVNQAIQRLRDCLRSKDYEVI